MPYEHLWKSNQKIIFILLILLLKSTTVPARLALRTIILPSICSNFSRISGVAYLKKFTQKCRSLSSLISSFSKSLNHKLLFSPRKFSQPLQTVRQSSKSLKLRNSKIFCPMCGTPEKLTGKRISPRFDRIFFESKLSKELHRTGTALSAVMSDLNWDASAD